MNIKDVIAEGDELFAGPDAFPADWVDSTGQWQRDVEAWWAKVKETLAEVTQDGSDNQC